MGRHEAVIFVALILTGRAALTWPQTRGGAARPGASSHFGPARDRIAWFTPADDWPFGEFGGAVSMTDALFISAQSGASTSSGAARLSPGNGTMVWETPLGSMNQGAPVETALSNNGSRLYVSSAPGGALSALDAESGAVAWTFGKSHTNMQGGRGLVIMNAGGRSVVGVWTSWFPAYFVALEDIGGEARELWRWDDPESCGYTCSVVGMAAGASVGARSLLVLSSSVTSATTSQVVAAVDAVSWQQLWNVSLPQGIVCVVPPIVTDSFAVLVTMFGFGADPHPAQVRLLHALTGSQAQTVEVAASPCSASLDLATGHLILSTVAGRYGNLSATVFAMDPANKLRTSWSLSVGPAETYSADLVLAGGRRAFVRAIRPVQDYREVCDLLVFDIPTDGSMPFIARNVSLDAAFHRKAPKLIDIYPSDLTLTNNGLWTFCGQASGLVA